MAAVVDTFVNVMRRPGRQYFFIVFDQRLGIRLPD